MEFEDVVKPLLEKIDALEQRMSAQDTKLDAVCGMNKALISNARVNNTQQPQENRVREYIEGGR